MKQDLTGRANLSKPKNDEGLVAHIYSVATEGAEAGGVQIWGESGIASEILPETSINEREKKPK